MLGVFVAYFITIVIFAGLYLTVNKVGVYYNGGENDLILSSSEVEKNSLSLGAGASDTDVSSFCGMDINNHMEGEHLQGHLQNTPLNNTLCHSQ